MAWCWIRADLWDSFSHLAERADLAKDVVDLRRVDEALSTCPVGCKRNSTICFSLDQELRAERGIYALIEELSRFCSSMGGAMNYVPSSCTIRENLLWDKLAIQCKLLVKSGLAKRPVDCVEVL